MSIEDIRDNAKQVRERNPATDEAEAASAALVFIGEWGKARRRIARIREKLRDKRDEAMNNGSVEAMRAYREALDIIRETDGEAT